MWLDYPRNTASSLCSQLVFLCYVHEHSNKVPFLIVGEGVRALASVGRKNGGSNFQKASPISIRMGPGVPPNLEC